MNDENIPPLPDDEDVRLAIGERICECGQLHILVQARDADTGSVSENIMNVSRSQAFALAEMITRPFLLETVNGLIAEVDAAIAIERAMGKKHG